MSRSAQVELLSTWERRRGVDLAVRREWLSVHLFGVRHSPDVLFGYLVILKEK